VLVVPADGTATTIGGSTFRSANMSASISRYAVLRLGCAFVLFVAVPDFARAVDSETQEFEPPKLQSAPAAKPDTKSTDKKKAPKAKQEQKEEKKSERKFLDGYRAAHAMIYRRQNYAAGIAKLKSLGHDDHPDVANLIGYSSRKLGRYDDAKFWYERALAADPTHTRTWSYYGMWHAEQGNLLKARDFLAKVETLCGTRCRAYTELKGVIEGTRVY
jgi:tetratricopeptide (TPR) repeat protein